jgi:hypothetical protein
MFTMTVAGAETFTIPKECIESVKFMTDMKKDCDARSKDVNTTLIVRGYILTAANGDPFDSTRQMALWSAVPSGSADCYRNVTLTNVRSGVAVREYTFPNAFVVDYNEDFDDGESVGVFTLMIKQKKDRIEQVAVSGEFLA